VRRLPGAREHVPPSAATQARLLSLRPYVRQSGDDLRHRWHLKSRSLLDYLLVGIGSGTGDFTVAGERFAVGAGDLIWIPPGIPHEMRGTSESMHCVYLHFDLAYDPARSHWDACIPGGVQDLSAWRERLPPPPPDPVMAGWCGRLAVRDSTSILERMAAISLEHQRAGTGQALLLSGQMLQLLAELLRNSDPRSAGDGFMAAPHRQRLRQAAATLREHGGDLPDLAELATRCHLSPAHFRKLFREQFGVSPRTFHRRARIHRACELLVYSGKNVSQVADALGFSCVHAFSRAFHETTGRSPREYLTGRRSRTPRTVAGREPI
jgi:AraC-like DNA-binding protein